MAGAKETPRQRMIGMMYLVLTALLALQVSNQILQKFVLLNDGMERTSKNYVLKNESMVGSIEYTIAQQGNNPKDFPKVDASKKVRAATKEIYEYLEGLKKELIEQSNAKNESGNFVNAALKNTEAAGNMFANQGKGEELKKKLNDYPKAIEGILKGVGITNLTFRPIARDAAEIELFANDLEAKNKSFVALNFVKSPVGAVLAILSQFQNEVLNIESEALTTMANTIGSFYFKADITEAKISAISNVVAAGTKFEGTMFIASSSSSATPTMTLDGRAIPVDEKGFGKIEFTATPAGTYDDRGLAKKLLRGEIITNVGGEDKVLPIEYEYYVAQPVIKITSEVVQQLYAGCANDLSIDVPALGNTYAPEFTVTNGDKIKGAKAGQVTIIPNASGKVTIGVSSGGNKIGDETFDIKPVPNPTISVLAANGSELDISQAQTTNVLSGVKIVAKSDPTFARTMARDANFAVTGGEITLVRNEVPRGAPVAIGAGLRGLLGSAAAGDIIVIRINQITRTNFRGEKIPMDFRGVITVRVK
ncbi:MAG: gliding motility protein GldM [Algoriphagus sp.]